MKKKITEKPVEIEDGQGSVVPFKVIPGGRLGLKNKPPIEGDWLSILPIGTYFLAGDKRSADSFLEEYFIVDKTEQSVHLEIQLVDKLLTRWVLPERFCQIRFCHEILGVFKDE